MSRGLDIQLALQSGLRISEFGQECCPYDVRFKEIIFASIALQQPKIRCDLDQDPEYECVLMYQSVVTLGSTDSIRLRRHRN